MTETRTVDQTIEPGDSVRSFDFDRRDLTGEYASFIEGVVEGFEEREGCSRYRIKVNRRITGGSPSPIVPDFEWVLPPVNGTPTTMGNVTNGVVKLDPSGCTDRGAEKAAMKITARIESEYEELNDQIISQISWGNVNPKRPATRDEFDSICLAAGAVKEWAAKLEEFAAMCAEGEANETDIDKFTPTC